MVISWSKLGVPCDKAKVGEDWTLGKGWDGGQRQVCGQRCVAVSAPESPPQNQ